MSEDLFKKRVPVTSPKHRDSLMFAAGMRTIVDELKGCGCALPGMRMAIAIAEATLAKEQIGISGHAYREAAKAGVDLSAVSAIYTQTAEDGSIEMLVESESPPA